MGRAVVRGEDVVGGVERINCTYPIEFNPWTLYARFRV